MIRFIEANSLSMNINSFFSFFSPADKKFFPLFEKATANLLLMGQCIDALVKSESDADRLRLTSEINQLENVGDNITHDIFLELSRNFITPFDREDVHALASRIDDVADYIHGAANRIEIYRFGTPTQAMKELGSNIFETVKQIHEAIALLKSSSGYPRIAAICLSIKSLETAADRIFDSALRDLFLNQHDAIALIKNKDILAALETATDRCDDVANVLESIIVKFS
jgi:predicted phosphate transport protein (TIGR00153 family)